MNRKEALLTLAASAVLLPQTLSSMPTRRIRSGGINHSVCKWCFPDHSVDELAAYAAQIGMGSVELLGVDEWPIVIKRGLTCAIGYGSNIGLNRGFNDPALHDQLLKDYSTSIPQAKDHGIKQLISFSGNRNGLSDEAGLENCAKGLEPIIKLAEQNDIIISMELLNSLRDHADYQCDNTAWGVALVDKVGSPNFKLLYDIYHMQVQEGNIIATIKKYHEYISHFHTAGVPGRHELDENQELQYPAIMKAILDTGYTGFIGHEFIPSKDNALKSLEEAVKVCSV
jgi:hydroxypyruvate isomerase